jgi:hypothetical protein
VDDSPYKSLNIENKYVSVTNRQEDDLIVEDCNVFSEHKQKKFEI